VVDKACSTASGNTTGEGSQSDHGKLTYLEKFSIE
jgi:hypothetical protein